jgi:hypothetical protein
VKLDAEARIEGPLDHPLAMHLKNLRGCEAAHQRLANSRRIGARLGGEKQRFGDGSMLRATMIWLATFVVCPSPLAPTCVIFLPNSSNVTWDKTVFIATAMVEHRMPTFFALWGCPTLFRFLTI